MQDPFVRDHRVEVGTAVELAPGLRVVTAPNAGPMTFTGTQTYLLGTESVAIIDPGPDDDAHLEALLHATAGSRVTHIVVTHAHVDHSVLARRLSELLKVRIHGFRPQRPLQSRAGYPGDESAKRLKGGEGIDASHRVDVHLEDGAIISCDEWEIEALHTPGHLSDHLCLVWRDTGNVFTGDHVMSWATTMVSPPDGDMGAFMRSLKRLANRLEDKTYFPGHGGPVTDPGAMIDWQIRHRLERESQILECLSGKTLTPGGIVELLYTDIDRRLVPAAERNVLAHLIDLAERGVVAAASGADPLGKYSRL